LDFEESVRSQDEPGILRSRDYFNALIKQEMDKGIKASRIILGGFSQGGAMSVFTGLTSPEKLGGVFGLSCYLLLSDRIKNYLPEEWANNKTPFFLAHGLDDEVVPFQFGKKSADVLKELGVEDVSFNPYGYVSSVFCLGCFVNLILVVLVTRLILRRSMTWRSSLRSIFPLRLMAMLLVYDLINQGPGMGPVEVVNGDLP
jgi:acetyl esterase/lipase